MGDWKVCHAVTLGGKCTHEESIQRKTNDNQSKLMNKTTKENQQDQSVKKISGTFNNIN